MNRFLILFNVTILCLGLHAQDLMDMPEGISTDLSNQRYLVSCWNTAGVVALDQQGNEEYFVLGLPHCANNLIVDDVLYVSYMSGVKGFSLADASEVYSCSLPGAVDPDGIALSQDGFLYVLSHNGRIYKLNLEDQTYEQIVNGGLGSYPQGMIYDPFHNRLLTCSYQTNSPIFTVDLPLGFTYELVQTELDNLDAMAIDSYGNVYVSCSGDNSVYRFDNEFSTDPEIVSSGHSGPSGLEIDEYNEILLVANFFTDTVDFVPIDFSGSNHNSIINDGLKLGQNSPNPFTPGNTRFQSWTEITYKAPSGGDTKLEVYNLKGELIRRFELSGNGQGYSSTISWDGRDRRGKIVPAGLYLYSLHASGRWETKKMMILK